MSRELAHLEKVYKVRCVRGQETSQRGGNCKVA